MNEKIGWQGTLLAVQPRISLLRSFDQRSHSYLGYALRVQGTIGEDEREFTVGIGKAAEAKHKFRAGDVVSGKAVPATSSLAGCSPGVACLPRAWPSPTLCANVSGEMLGLHLGLPDAG